MMKRKAKSNKIFSLLLTLIMLWGIFSGLGSAVHAQGTVEITGVEITGVPTPMIGASCYVDPGAIEINTVPENGACVADVYWYDRTFRKRTTANDTFDSNHTYYLCVKLEPNAGYAFKLDSGSSATYKPLAGTAHINGVKAANAQESSTSATGLDVSGVALNPKNNIKSVAITTSPQEAEVGQPCDNGRILVTTNPLYATRIVDSGWYDETLDKKADIFIEGNRYYFYAILEPNAYNVFKFDSRDDTYLGTVTLNGKKPYIANREYGSDNNLYIADKSVVATVGNASVKYRAGIQGSPSWQSWKQDGALSGNTGKGLRMEGLQLKLVNNTPYKGGIRYNAQIQNIGWQGWKAEGETAGFNPKKSGGLRLESIKIELTGELAEHYDVWYHMHTQRFGWMDWAKNGEPAGTVGYSFRVEAVEVLILPKRSLVPTECSKVQTDSPHMISYVRTNSYDDKKWQGNKGEGDVSGTRGKKKTAITMGLSQSGIPAEYKGNSGITYRIYQDGKWSAWVDKEKVAGRATGGAIQGMQVKLTGNMAKDYDVYYRVEVKNGTKAYWMNWAKNRASAGWKGKNLEQIQVAIVPKGEPAPTTENAKQRFVLQLFRCNTTRAAVGL